MDSAFFPFLDLLPLLINQVVSSKGQSFHMLLISDYTGSCLIINIMKLQQRDDMQAAHFSKEFCCWGDLKDKEGCRVSGNIYQHMDPRMKSAGLHSRPYKRVRKRHIQTDIAWLELPCCSNCIRTKCQSLWQRCQLLVLCGCFLNGIQDGGT